MGLVRYHESDDSLEVSLRFSRLALVYSAVITPICAFLVVALSAAVVRRLLDGVPPTWGVAYSLLWVAVWGVQAAIGLHILLYSQKVLLLPGSYVLQHMRATRVMGDFERGIPPGTRFSPGTWPGFFDIGLEQYPLMLGDEKVLMGRGLINKCDADQLASRFNQFLDRHELTEQALHWCHSDSRDT